MKQQADEEKAEVNIFYHFSLGCGSGLIQSGYGSSILAQSGSGFTSFLNPDPMRIRVRIYKRKF
jgi:hypothetical protein